MVGSNLRERFAHARQHEVIAPDRVQLDLLDEDAVVRFLKDTKPDMVIHAAGRVGGIQANIAKPVAFLSDNLAMGRNVLLAARTVGVERVINLASSCMYPREAENPLREEMILTGKLEPTNEGYALAKIAVMRLGEYLNREAGIEWIKTLIPCNLYGRYDTFDPAASHLIPAIIFKLHEAKRTGDLDIEIWGSGEARREFMYAGDLADAITCTVDRFDNMPAVMNLGVGQDHSVNEYYRLAAELVGWSGTFRHDLTRPVGMMQKLLAVDRQQAWGWQPRWSLRDGLKATYEHYLERSVQ